MGLRLRVAAVKALIEMKLPSLETEMKKWNLKRKSGFYSFF